MNAIVLAFDRLPLSFLGCYGNAWIETPNFDRLAAESVVFDQHFAEDVGADGPQKAWWSGRFECRPHRGGPDDRSLPAVLQSAGVTFKAIVESGGAGRVPADGGDASLTPTEYVHGVDGLNAAADETPFFRLVARARTELRRLQTSRQEPWALWLQSRGVPTPWLAPRPFATRFLDLEDDDDDQDDINDETEGDEIEDDDNHGADESPTLGSETIELSPEELDSFLSSLGRLPHDDAQRRALTDAQRVIIRKLVGGYVALLDAGLGLLLEAIDAVVATSPTLVILTAAKGLTVREPGILRGRWERLADENVHAPLLVRQPGVKAGRRSQQLVQSVDLFPTLAHWFQADASALSFEGQDLLQPVADAGTGRTAAFFADGDCLAGIRTPEHLLVVDAARDLMDTDSHHLFSKPDDVWETNDLASQNADVVKQLSTDLGTFRQDNAPEA